MEYMLKSNKEYVCLMFLHKPVEKELLKETFKKFTGIIKQTPPIVSAVKRQERERNIYYNDIINIKENQYILFRVGCQHGTYIRKLCSDMGEDLGVSAQMIELRRTKAGPIREEDNIISLDKLRNLYELYNEEKDSNTKNIYEKELKKYIRPMEEVLKDFKVVIARDSAVDTVCHGSDLAVPGVSKLCDDIDVGEEVAVITHKGELIAMGTAFMTSKEVMKKNKGAFIKTDKVFMDIGTYPAYWNFKKEK
jgi:H/ACA ribonucleoprotein complex subunit 4